MLVRQQTTEWVLYFLAVALVAYATLAAWKGEEGASISEKLHELGENYPLFVIALGFLLGHVFGKLCGLLAVGAALGMVFWSQE